jgi:hypothetical protein
VEDGWTFGFNANFFAALLLPENRCGEGAGLKPGLSKSAQLSPGI